MKFRVTVTKTITESVVFDTSDLHGLDSEIEEVRIMEVAKFISELQSNPQTILDDYKDEISTESEVENVYIDPVIPNK